MKKLPLLLFAFLLCTVSAFTQTEVDAFLEKANQYRSEKKFDEAAAELGKAISVQPNNAYLYLERANFYWLSKKNQELLNDVQKAVSINPTDKKILNQGASLLHRAEQHSEALKIADALFALGEPDVSAWGLRIRIKTYLEDFIGAFEDATKAIEIFPQANVFRQNQANLIRLMGDSDKALELYDALILSLEAKLNKVKDENERAGLKRDISFVLFSRARINFTKFNNEQARADLIKVIEIAPEIYNYFQRAKIYRQQKMYAEAIADLTKAIEFDTKSQEVMFYIDRGGVYYLVQKYAEAIADYEQAAKMDDGLKEITQKKIFLARQKMEKNTVQPN